MYTIVYSLNTLYTINDRVDWLPLGTYNNDWVDWLPLSSWPGGLVTPRYLQ